MRSDEIIPNPLHARSIMELIHTLIEAVVFVGVIVLLLALVWVGAQFVFAQGAPEKLQEARRSLIWTVIGGAILLGAEGIALIIEATAYSI